MKVSTFLDCIFGIFGLLMFLFILVLVGRDWGEYREHRRCRLDRSDAPTAQWDARADGSCQVQDIPAEWFAMPLPPHPVRPKEFVQ